MAERERLTADRVAGFKCPEGKLQAFKWDLAQAGLALRATAKGARAYVFQSRTTSGQSVRMTIGEPASWSIREARAEARRLQKLIDQGKDPRSEKAALVARHVAERAAAKVERQRMEVTGLDAWSAYCEERRPSWSELNHADNIAYASAGGVQRKRAKAMTKPGPLYALLNRPLALIDAETVEKWVTREMRTRCEASRRCFLTWR